MYITGCMEDYFTCTQITQPHCMRMPSVQYVPQTLQIIHSCVLQCDLKLHPLPHANIEEVAS